MEINRELVGNSVVISHGFQLEYYVLEIDLNKSKQKKSYGIEIIKKNMNEIIESSRIYEISENKSWTKNLAIKLAKNTVTPIGLKDIISDIKPNN